jgi:DNA-binding PadR family transcriptional regulator
MKHQHQLPRVAFSILLALSLKPRHGYEIIQQVEEDSSGKVKLGPGALYTSIKQLVSQKLIEELPQPDSHRRRYYQLTIEGRTVLDGELAYYEQAIILARQRNTLAGGTI